MYSPSPKGVKPNQNHVSLRDRLRQFEDELEDANPIPAPLKSKTRGPDPTVGGDSKEPKREYSDVHEELRMLKLQIQQLEQSSVPVILATGGGGGSGQPSFPLSPNSQLEALKVTYSRTINNLEKRVELQETRVKEQSRRELEETLHESRQAHIKELDELQRKVL